MKKILEKIKVKRKYVSYMFVAIMLILSTVFYSNRYLTNAFSLLFTKQDSIYLFLFFCMIIFVSIFLIYFVNRVDKLENHIIELKETLEMNHHEQIKMSMVTQEIVLDSRKEEVGNDE